MITIKRAVEIALNRYEEGQVFSGRNVYEKTLRYLRSGGNPANPYVDTVLRRVRASKVNGKREIVCVSKHKSLYKKLRKSELR